MTESMLKKPPPNPPPTRTGDGDVWQCPVCQTFVDLEKTPDGVAIRCPECGFTGRGDPLPDWAID